MSHRRDPLLSAPGTTARFSSALCTALAGAALAVFALTARTPVVAWVQLGIGCAVAATILTAFAVHGLGPAARAIDVVIVVVAGWSIVASRAFDGPALAKWLGFADGALIAGLGVVALVAHEVLVERRLHAAQASIGDRAEATGPDRALSAAHGPSGGRRRGEDVGRHPIPSASGR